MLVISRKPGEKLRIGEQVELTVLEISGSRVVIGIDAPREVVIRRVGSSAAEEMVATDAPVMTEESEVAKPVAEAPSAAVAAAAPATAAPFEYPSRRVEESAAPPRRAAPVVTVKRSRRIDIPEANGGADSEG